MAAPLSLPATQRTWSPTLSLNDLKADFARDHVRDANPSPRVAALAMSSPREANLVEEEAAPPAPRMSKTLGAADMPAPAQSPSRAQGPVFATSAAKPTGPGIMPAQLRTP